MKPPILDRLRKEDITEAPEWFDRVMVVLNRFLETVVQLFTKNITFQDNIDSQIYTDTINASALTSGYSFKVTTKEQPKGLWILKLVKTTDTYTVFTVAPFPLWSYADQQITIHNILGIDSTSDYRVTLLII